MERIYIAREQYKVLAQMMAHCGVATQFPVSYAHASGLYFTRRRDIEIRTPACLILLSRRSYDERHAALLDNTRMVRLINIDDEPGWWLMEDL